MINLLIVDDDIATVDVIRDSVNWSALGIDQVFTSLNVSGARIILQEQAVDIIISDIEMPQESGLDLLKWVRAENIECEFLFFTCHENFSYASNAINFAAAAYLTKPFDMDIMELNLQKIVAKLKQKRSLKVTNEYGQWMEKNLHLMKLDFWKAVLDGELDAEQIKEEVKERRLPIQTNIKYCLIYSKVRAIGGDVERYGKGTFDFIVEDFHSEILTGKVENERVIKVEAVDSMNLITICDEEQPENLKLKCQDLIETCRGYFDFTITCCIGNPAPITELSATSQRLKRLSDYNISFLGRMFLEQEAEISAQSEAQIIDMEYTISLVEKKDKAQILRYLKKVFDELSVCNRLNQHALYLMKQEIMQLVYADLMKQGIHATKLFYDEMSIKLADHAIDSTVDMVRWVSFLLEKTFAYEEEITKSATIIDKVNTFIQNHYSEDIGRNEVAGAFYLTPEYLAKLYKKKTGMNLKDYINAYRIEKAKELLISGNKNISHIADAVGFDNFSYFSTLFKKLTGVSPKDYKHN